MDRLNQLLQEIRDEVRRGADRANARFEQMERRFERLDERFERADERFERMDHHFEVLETTLRDLAQQTALLARAVKLVP